TIAQHLLRPRFFSAPVLAWSVARRLYAWRALHAWMLPPPRGSLRQIRPPVLLCLIVVLVLQFILSGYGQVPAA
ncbi:unnamed protein product, partial [Amoebophrya sp. A120]